MKKLSKITILLIFILLFCFAFILANNALAYKCSTFAGGKCTTEADCPGPTFGCTVAEDCTSPTTCCCVTQKCSDLGGECKADCGTAQNYGYTNDCAQKCCGASTTTSPAPTTGGTTPTTGTGTGPAQAPAGTGSSTVDISGIQGLGTISVPELLGRMIKTILGIVGALALLMVVWGGIILLTSRGGEGVKKGKDILIWATIGVAVVLGSYALVNYVITGIGGGGGTTGGETGGQTPTTTTPKTCSEAHPAGTCGALPCGEGFAEDTINLCPDKTKKCCYWSGTKDTCTTLGGTCVNVTPCNIDNPNSVSGCAQYLANQNLYKSCTLTSDCDITLGQACCIAN